MLGGNGSSTTTRGRNRDRESVLTEDRLMLSAIAAAVAAAITVLVVGDFSSTFFYHVPQHLWFTLHLRTHHDRRRSYWDHAVISTDPAVLLDGLLGAVPYLVVAAGLWHVSALGALAGLALGQL